VPFAKVYDKYHMLFQYDKLEYYVYAYLNADCAPYYIGKGKNNRAFQKHKNVITPPANRIVILENNLSEIGAFAIERQMIRWYGRKFNNTGILENKHEGGPIKSIDREAQWKLYLEEEFGFVNGDTTGWIIDPYARLVVLDPQL
jgi:hypothetical protein